jgi:hypothetical protein
MAINESCRQSMSNSLRPNLDPCLVTVRAALEVHDSLHSLAQHGGLASVEEAMIGQRHGIPFNAAVAGSHIGHAAGRLHVAILALFALTRGGTGLPLAECAVDVDTENHAFMTRSTVAAIAIQRRVGIFAAIHVVKSAEKELTLGRT